ncbi:MAG: DUF6065 family protein [Pseudomonadota bacterium]
MKLKCFPLSNGDLPKIEPGPPERDWMEAFRGKHPYRCLPLVVANTTGWRLTCPISFRATWNGGPELSDLVIEPPFGVSARQVETYAASHFGGGVLTFHTHYLFRTPKGWDLWVGGPPNAVKHGIQALSGIIETDWLPMSFTMNWRFTAPGSVSFSAGEAFCFIMPVPHAAIDEFEPVIESLADNPDVERDINTWTKSRADFLSERSQGMHRAQDWQRHYFHGINIDGTPGTDTHVHKRRLKAPRPAVKGESE